MSDRVVATQEFQGGSPRPLLRNQPPTIILTSSRNSPYWHEIDPALSGLTYFRDSLFALNLWVRRIQFYKVLKTNNTINHPRSFFRSILNRSFQHASRTSKSTNHHYNIPVLYLHPATHPPPNFSDNQGPGTLLRDEAKKYTAEHCTYWTQILSLHSTTPRLLWLTLHKATTYHRTGSQKRKKREPQRTLTVPSFLML
jgi:hypothetical protein